MQSNVINICNCHLVHIHLFLAEEVMHKIEEVLERHLKQVTAAQQSVKDEVLNKIEDVLQRHITQVVPGLFTLTCSSVLVSYE